MIISYEFRNLKSMWKLNKNYDVITSDNKNLHLKAVLIDKQRYFYCDEVNYNFHERLFDNNNWRVLIRARKNILQDMYDTNTKFIGVLNDMQRRLK